MKLDRLQKQIICGILATRTALQGEKRKFNAFVITRWEASHRMDVRNAKESGSVRISLHEWLGHPPAPRESVKASRVFAKLESAGLLERVNSTAAPARRICD